MIAVFAILTTCLAAIFFVHKNQKNEKIRKMK
uniref:Uncharacterized protein n=1 Tax=Panagrolaimus sp. JU765 TaxID=591449 RepID=A0AC34PYG7_9BILA